MNEKKIPIQESHEELYLRLLTALERDYRESITPRKRREDLYDDLHKFKQRYRDITGTEAPIPVDTIKEITDRLWLWTIEEEREKWKMEWMQSVERRNKKLVEESQRSKSMERLVMDSEKIERITNTSIALAEEVIKNAEAMQQQQKDQSVTVVVETASSVHDKPEENTIKPEETQPVTAGNIKRHKCNIM